MKLFEKTQVVAMLDHQQGSYMAMTRNDNGAVIAFGSSIATAIDALRDRVAALRTPQAGREDDWHHEG